MDQEHTPQHTPRTRNRSLALDGLPMEMFKDVKRACHRRLLETDPSYVIEQERITLWCSRKRIRRAPTGIPANPPATRQQPTDG